MASSSRLQRVIAHHGDLTFAICWVLAPRVSKSLQRIGAAAMLVMGPLLIACPDVSKVPNTDPSLIANGGDSSPEAADNPAEGDDKAEE